jgi:hypothetical protein
MNMNLLKSVFWSLVLFGAVACQTQEPTQSRHWDGLYRFEESMPSVNPKSRQWRWEYLLEVRPTKQSGNYTAELSIKGFKTMLSLDCIGNAVGDSLQIIFQDYPPDAEQMQYNTGDLLVTLYQPKDKNLTTYWRGLVPNVEENLAQGRGYFQKKAELATP